MTTRFPYTIGIGLLAVALIGCGTTKSQRATEQLLMSDAVDRSVASIDFRPLSGRRVFLDTTYVKNVRSEDFVNVDYIISSVRQQMVTAGCLLEDAADSAEYIAEMRVGTLGADSHDVTYGIPANNSLNSAASLVPSAPAMPIIPEIALARKNSEQAAAKIAIFAYHRETRRPVWQSGVAQARSRAKDMWIFGAGPFQSGTIHDGTEFVDKDLPIPLLTDGHDDMTSRADPLATYSRSATYLPPQLDTGSRRSEVTPASYGGAPPPASTAPAEVPPTPADAVAAPSADSSPPPSPPPEDQE